MIISTMRFGVPVVRDFLAEHGCVLTVRGYDYRSGTAIVPDLGNIRIKRKKLGEIKTEEDLNGFVPLSGFKTARDWWVQIRRFCKGRMYLYRVQIDDDYISQQERDYEKREHQRATKQLVIDDVPGFEVNRTRYKYMDGSTSMEEYNVYDDMSHSLDIRSDPALHDPALVDLSGYKEQAHRERLEAEARRAERRRERLRKKYAEQMRAI